MMRRRRVVLIVVALLGLLWVAQVQYGLTVVGALWRAILSWDNAATHQFEALAAVTPPLADSREAHDHHLAARRLVGHLPLPEGETAARRLALSRQITRSPPAAHPA